MNYALTDETKIDHDENLDANLMEESGHWKLES